MSPATVLAKIDWWRVLREGGLAVVAILLAVALLIGRRDPGTLYTKEEARAQRIIDDARMKRIEDKLDELAVLQKAHTSLAMHAGSFERFSEMKADIKYITLTIAKIEQYLSEKK